MVAETCRSLSSLVRNVSEVPRLRKLGYHLVVEKQPGGKSMQENDRFTVAEVRRAAPCS